MSIPIDPNEYILYKGELVATPQDLIYPDRYRVHVRGRPGRPSKGAEFDILARHMQCFNAIRADIDAGKPLCPSPGVHGLGPIAVWYLYTCRQDLHSFLTPAAFLYYRNILRNRMCGLDIGIEYERCLL